MQNPNFNLERLLRELRQMTLRDESKIRMRAELSQYADFHTPVSSEASAAPTSSVLAWFGSRSWYVPGAALLLILLAGGTSYASEDSLPGQPLYMVKVKITEPIAVALATTPEKKAETHTKLAERRLEEAAKLAVKQDLNPDTQGFLEQDFGEHVDETLAAAQTLEVRGQIDEAIDARSHLEARLLAHSEILDIVEDHLEEAGAGAEIAHDSTQHLIHAVELRKDVVTEARIALERSVEDSITPAQSLALVTEASSEASPEANSALFPTVAEHALKADDALSAAKDSLENDRPDRAFREALAAKRNTEVVSTLLEHSDIFMSLETPATTTPPTDPNATTTPATTTPQSE